MTSWTLELDLMGKFLVDLMAASTLTMQIMLVFKFAFKIQISTVFMKNIVIKFRWQTLLS